MMMMVVVVIMMMVVVYHGRNPLFDAVFCLCFLLKHIIKNRKRP